MHQCLKDSNSSYKGDEPSPKGFGYCAHCEKLGTKMKGKDGNIWIIKEVKNGSKRWIKFSSDIEKKGKKYYIHFNGSRPFEVVINGKDVSVYKRMKYDGRKFKDYEEYNKSPYDIFVAKFKPKKIYIGNDNTYPKFSLGNTILLDMGKNKYVCIQEPIIEFTLEDGDEFIDFSSLLVGSDVPEPLILGKNNLYSLIEMKYSSKKYYPENWKKIDDYINWRDYYDRRIDNKTKKMLDPIVKVKKRLKNLKIIK